MQKRKRGRKHGEFIGQGAIQQFIKNRGGKKYIQELYKKVKSADAIAQSFIENDGFYCCGNSIRNYMKRYNLELNEIGGDRRSKRILKFRETRNF